MRPVAGRFARAPYLRSCWQLHDELIQAAGLREPVLATDEEPADPPAHLEARLAAALRVCCRKILDSRPAVDRQPGAGALPDHLVAAITRLLALPHATIRGVARQAGVDAGVVQQLARGVYRHRQPVLRCPDCGGKVLNPDEPCRLCSVRRVRSARPSDAQLEVEG